MQYFSLWMLAGYALGLITAYLVHRCLNPPIRCERCGTCEEVKLALGIDSNSERIYELGILCRECHMEIMDELEERSLAELN